MSIVKRGGQLLSKALRNPSRVGRSVYFKMRKALSPDSLLEPSLEKADFRMKVYAGDPGLSQQLYVWGWREEHETDFVREFLREGDLVVDAGANIGFYVLLEAEAIGTSGRIIAVEPSPKNCTLLRKNVAMNGWEDRVEIVQGAISSEKGSATLNLTKHFNLNSLNSKRLDEITDIIGQVEVPVFGITDLLKDHGVSESQVSLVRMDVEGHEVDVINGMKRLLTEIERIGLLIEVHPELIEATYGPSAYGELLDTIENAGLRVERVATNVDCRQGELVVGFDFEELRATKGVYSALFVKGVR